MEASDWIAIAALGATVIVSIVGYAFNYLTNKDNIRAKRAEIVMERNVEAFREVAEKIVAVMDSADRYFRDKESVERVKEAVKDFRETFTKNFIYIPADVSTQTFGITSAILEHIESDANSLENRKQLEDLVDNFADILVRMQALAGL